MVYSLYKAFVGAKDKVLSNDVLSNPFFAIIAIIIPIILVLFLCYVMPENQYRSNVYIILALAFIVYIPVIVLTYTKAKAKSGTSSYTGAGYNNSKDVIPPNNYYRNYRNFGNYDNKLQPSAYSELFDKPEINYEVEQKQNRYSSRISDFMNMK